MEHFRLPSRLARVLVGNEDLAPCRLCGTAAPPEVRRLPSRRRMVRCRGCGHFMIAPAPLSDNQIGDLWNERARRCPTARPAR